MLERAAHWLSGWAQWEIQGNPARFLNAAARSGVEFWGFRRERDRTTVRGNPRQARLLRNLSRRCGVRLRLRKKGGLPFYTARIARRKGLGAGAVCGAALYLFLSGYCWGVTVSGTVTLTDRQVLEAARASGVYVGARRSSLDSAGAARALENDLPGVSWLAVNTDGCYVEVALREQEEAPPVVDDRRWSNMVAARAGTVISVEAESGRPEVKPGDTVEQGQLLIAGLYQEEPDPYTPLPVEPVQTLGAARGSVQALTYREFQVSVDRVQTQWVPTGEQKRAASLSVLGWSIPLGWNSSPKSPCRVWTERRTWNPLGQEVPLAWVETVYEFVYEETRQLSEAELREAALRELRRVQKEQLPEGSRIVEEELDFQFSGAVCVLQARCRCHEEIGVVQEIQVN